MPAPNQKNVAANEFAQGLQQIKSSKGRKDYIKNFLLEQIATVAAIDTTAQAWDCEKNFAEVGIDSLMAVELRARIKTMLGEGANIPLTYIYDYPSVNALIDYIEQQFIALGKLTTMAKKRVHKNVSRQQKISKLKLICFPSAGGGASMFSAWKEFLPKEIELIGVQYPGREERFNESFAIHIPELINDIITTLKPILNSPFVLYGHSLGSIIAFELIRELRRKKMPMPKHMIISSFYSPRIFSENIERLINMNPISNFTETFIKLGMIPKKILNNEELKTHFLKILKADVQLGNTYHYQTENPLECSISAFIGTKDPLIKITDITDWQSEAVRNFNLKVFAGDHFFWQNRTEIFVKELLNELLIIIKGHEIKEEM
jgi:surfactin synthase thioesterase subunit/acyl carrier protein